MVESVIMKKYNPNFSDPRIQKRINRSLDYAFANLSTTKETQWAKTQIDRWFGQSQNPLSAMIRSELLICRNPYYKPIQLSGTIPRIFTGPEGCPPKTFRGENAGDTPISRDYVSDTGESCDRFRTE
mgnify:CR=1 FL=1